MNHQSILQRIQTEIVPYLNEGKVASYIPALASANPSDFALSICLVDGKSYHVGLSEKRFSIQSISKVFLYSMAAELFGEELLLRVGVEPSGNPFNSLVQLEYENGIPRNPFINPGAIVIADMLVSHFGESAKDEVLRYIRNIAKDESICIDDEIASSEHDSGFRNYALANLMKSFANIKNPVEDVLKLYFNACSITANTSILSRAMLHLASSGKDPLTHKQILKTQNARRINALMLTCGHYDASGEFAYRVGLPGKSGVGGGIVAVVPNTMSIAVYSPALNEHGNSLAGTKALELFANYSGSSVF